MGTKTFKIAGSNPPKPPRWMLEEPKAKTKAKAKAKAKATVKTKVHDITVALDPSAQGAAARMKAYLEGKKLDVTHTSEHRVEAQGTPKALKAAFGVKLRGGTSEGRDFMFHEQPVSLPVEFEDEVRWVFGLDTNGTATHTGFHITPDPQREVTPAPLSLRPGLGFPRYSIAQIRSIYDFPEGDGEGRCVAIIALKGGYDPKTMKAYFKQLGISPAPKILLWKKKNAYGCYSGNPPLSDPISDYQVTQTLQILGALLPKATLVVYNANSPRATRQDWFKALSAVIDDESLPKPEVIVNPWVFVENPSKSFGVGICEEQARPFEKLFKTYAKRGITLCTASGSAGGMVPVSSGVEWPAVAYPASSRWALAVGGTTLHHDPTGRRREEVWNRSRFSMTVQGTASNAGATGGGYSAFFAAPDYQSGVNLPSIPDFSWDVADTLRMTREGTHRGVPDVSCVADALTGVDVYFQKKWGVAGGTGVSVTLWGALVVLLNQHVYPDNSGSLGFLNDELYRLALASENADEDERCFEPIVGGHNGAWDATPGPWNPCCGLGVPRGKRLARALVRSKQVG